MEGQGGCKAGTCQSSCAKRPPLGAGAAAAELGGEAAALWDVAGEDMAFLAGAYEDSGWDSGYLSSWGHGTASMAMTYVGLHA